MKTIISFASPNVKAKCNSCGWKGSKYEVKMTLTATYCPKCGSDKVELYISKKRLKF
jgi:Zn finger protein HypA/HybF involved in hydrogenase expression